MRSFVGPSDVYSLIRSYFCDRIVRISWEGVSFEMGVSRGCPQSSVLGSLFWLGLFDDLLRLDFCPGVPRVAYADDLVLLVGAGNRLELEERCWSPP